MTEKTKWKTEAHSLFDGDCEVYTTNQSNGVYQIGVWVSVEGKMYRKSLRTKHLETALAKAKTEYISIRSKVDQGNQRKCVFCVVLIGSKWVVAVLCSSLMADCLPMAALQRLRSVRM